MEEIILLLNYRIFHQKQKVSVHKSENYDVNFLKMEFICIRELIYVKDMKNRSFPLDKNESKSKDDLINYI